MVELVTTATNKSESEDINHNLPKKCRLQSLYSFNLIFSFYGSPAEIKSTITSLNKMGKKLYYDRIH